MPKVSIIIATLEGKRLLEPLLRGVFEQQADGLETDVLVVDNGSPEDNRSFLKNQFPEARHLELKRNHGFTPAVNLGIKASDGEFIILLNDDCKVYDGWLSELMKPFSTNPAVACVGSLILDESGERIDFQTGTANIFGWGFHKDKGESKQSVRDEPFRAFFACGASAAYRRDAMEEAGGLLDESFAYFEDVEIGWRLNALGYEVWMNPSSIVEHQHGATVRRFGPGFHSFLTERNALINAWCNLAPVESDVIIPMAFSLSSLRLAARAGSTPEPVLGAEGLKAIFHTRGDEVPHRSAQESLKNTLKMTRFGRGVDWAPVEGLADFGLIIPRITDRRDSLEQKRKRATSELLELMDEPFRPVIGHPREKAFIEDVEPFIREALK